MNASSVQMNDSLPKRVLWLYGLFMLLSNAAYVLAYYFLPEGLLRGSPMQAAARVAATGTFWSQLASTFLINLGIVIVLSVAVNLIQVRGFPLGYLWPIVTAVRSGVLQAQTRSSCPI